VCFVKAPAPFYSGEGAIANSSSLFKVSVSVQRCCQKKIELGF
jgi:hypothetical protein